MGLLIQIFVFLSSNVFLYFCFNFITLHFLFFHQFKSIALLLLKKINFLFSNLFLYIIRHTMWNSSRIIKLQIVSGFRLEMFHEFNTLDDIFNFLWFILTQLFLQFWEFLSHRLYNISIWGKTIWSELREWFIRMLLLEFVYEILFCNMKIL